MERRYCVGYALAPKKQASFIQLSLIELARNQGIDFIKIDLSKPLIEQGPFDCVLHKIHGHDWENQLIQYSSNFPNALIIDSPQSIKRLHNRVSMLQVVSDLRIDCHVASFGIPKQLAINDCNELSEFRIEGEGLKFPVIAKPLVADGSEKSHKMSLVYNNVGLNELKVRPPIVLQEFVNHGGVIFKVYVVGGYVKCVKRKSLADINEDKLGSLEGVVSFSQVSNVSSSEKTGHEEYHRLMMDLEEIELPPLSLITDIAIGLKKATKLHLFNFDVIRDTKVGNRYLVIDINYFPGYAKMPDYERVLTDFFWDVLSKDKKGVGSFKKPESREKGVRLLVNTGCSEDDGMVLPVSPLKREEKEDPIQV